MKIYRLLIIVLVGLLCHACGEEVITTLESDAPVPQPVTGVKVENLPGAAHITYELPKGNDLLYVEAEYTLNSGQKITVQSSHFDNLIAVEGFGDTSEYEVDLYAVGRSLKRSAPTSVVIHPREPPVHRVFKSLAIYEDFGGLTLDFENEHEADIVLTVLKKDSLDDWNVVDVFYTSRRVGRLAVRGMDAVESTFGIYVRDRWDNHSETREVDITPLYEERVPREGFREATLATDAAQWQGTRMSNLWSDDLAGSNTGTTGWFRTANGVGVPHHFTFDLGAQVKLSRYILHQRGVIAERHLVYNGGSPRLFEIWGANDPAPDGSFDGWTKLLDCEIVKPSGRPAGDNSNEDLEVALAGHEFSFPVEAEPMRFIRIRVLRTFGNADYSWISNLAFYGQITD